MKGMAVCVCVVIPYAVGEKLPPSEVPLMRGTAAVPADTSELSPGTALDPGRPDAPLGVMPLS